MQKNIYQLSCDVYNAINIYNNYNKHKLLKSIYHKIYNDYKLAGGKETIEFFEQTIDQYNLQCA